MDLINESCKNFAELLASKTSVPGGGGASALVGALGIALCSMAGNFTLGKKKYADVEDDIKIILDKAEKLRIKFLDLIDEDAKAFTPLAEAYSIPKDAPKRSEILESATVYACKAPIEIMECCAEAVDLLCEMSEKGSRLLISDVGCGALLCESAMKAAALNVFINTSSLNDKKTAESIELKIDNILKEYSPKALNIAEKVNQIIRK